MNAYDRWLTTNPHEEAEGRREAMEEEANETVADLLAKDDKAAADLFDEAVGYRSPEQALALTRAYLTGDAVAMMALMTTLYEAAVEREVEREIITMEESEASSAAEHAEYLYNQRRDDAMTGYA